MSEKHIENAILSYLSGVGGVFAFKIPDQRQCREGIYYKNPWMPRGIPDICVILPQGKTLWIEVKSATGRLSKYQLTFHKKLIEFDHTIFVVNSVEQVKKLLDI